MTTEHDRRRFLQLTGTGAAATIAGCADINPLSDGEENGEHADLLTAVVGPDSEDFEELREAVDNEELGPTEAQQRQQELYEEAIADFEARAEDDSDLEIQDSAEEYGLYRIDGSATAVVEALQEGSVAALYEGAAYDQILENEEQQQQPEPAPEEGADPDGDGTGDADDADGNAGNDTDGESGGGADESGTDESGGDDDVDDGDADDPAGDA